MSENLIKELEQNIQGLTIESVKTSLNETEDIYSLLLKLSDGTTLYISPGRRGANHLEVDRIKPK